MTACYFTLIFFVWSDPLCGDVLSVSINDREVRFSPPAIVNSGSVFMEVGNLFNLLDTQVFWSPPHDAFVSTEAQNKVVFFPEARTLKIGSRTFYLEHAPVQVRDYTYVCVEDFSSVFAFAVSRKNSNVSLVGDFRLTSSNRRLPHYNIEAILSQGKIFGHAQITYYNFGELPEHSLFFSLPAASINPESQIKVYSTAVDGDEVQFEAGETYLRVFLNGPLFPEESCTVDISFDTYVPQSRSRLGQVGSSGLLSCWYPAVPLSSSVPVYSPFGEPYSFCAATFEIELTVDPGTQVYGGLAKVEKTLRDDRIVYKFLSKEPIRDAAFVVGTFQTQSVQVDETTIYYISNGHTPGVLNTAVQAFNYFEACFGEYPYETLTLADLPLEEFYGMEYGGLLILSTINKPDTMTVVHEISHQWWYGLVGSDQEKEAWIDEGLANFSTMLFFEEKNGRGAYADLLRSLKNRANGYGGPEAIPLHKYPSKENYRADAYARGALFWDGVRSELGRKETIAFLREIQEVYRHGIVSSDDILRYLNQKYPGQFEY